MKQNKLNFYMNNLRYKEDNVKTYIKSPFNYTGGKFKLLPQILPLFPEQIDTFVDLFGGGANVSLNVDADVIIYNDIIPYVGTFLDNLRGNHNFIKWIENEISIRGLSKSNVEAFVKLRDDYNKSKDWKLFYLLTCYSFNYQFRFNNNFEYNSSFGKDKSQYSESMKTRLIQVIERLDNISLMSNCNDFRYIDSLPLDNNDFVYVDPPYLASTASYCDGKRGYGGWNIELENDLHEKLDHLDKNNVKFAMSNVLENKGQSNDILKQWAKKYNIHFLNYNYGNSNYQAKDKSKNSTAEVLITNY